MITNTLQAYILIIYGLNKKDIQIILTEQYKHFFFPRISVGKHDL